MLKHLFKLEGPDLVVMVQQVISEKILDKVGFTKWDITNRLRSQVGTYVEVRHDDVKEVVEAYMSTRLDYSSKENPLLSAIEYYPTPTISLQDIKVDIKADLFGFNKALQTVNQSIASAFNKYTPPNTIRTLSLNKRGLCIPKELIQKANKISNTVLVSFDNKDYQSYYIDMHGNVGITRSRLEKVLGQKNVVELSLDNSNNIVIK